MATIKVTASLGVGALREEDTIETFVKRADDAMYTAKRDGRNRVVSAT
jgi:diguanylate cyclase (GGDEF)-like protein